MPPPYSLLHASSPLPFFPLVSPLHFCRPLAPVGSPCPPFPYCRGVPCFRCCLHLLPSTVLVSVPRLCDMWPSNPIETLSSAVSPIHRQAFFRLNANPLRAPQGILRLPDLSSPPATGPSTARHRGGCFPTKLPPLGPRPRLTRRVPLTLVGRPPGWPTLSRSAHTSTRPLP